MSYPVYYVEQDDTLPHLFDTYDGGTGASITMTGLAVTDIEIYKDGGTTQRSSDNGYTLLDTDGIDFDGVTGIHGFSIDLSDNSDAGFYTVGSWYHVVISSITVDSQTVNFVACAFRIVSPTRGMAGTALPDAAADAAGGLSISDAGGLDMDAIGTAAGTVTDAAAAGDPSTSESIMQYVKQLVNILIGTTGVTTFPAEAAPGNNVSLAEVVRAIHADVTGLNGDAMRGTDSALLAASAPSNFGDLSITATTGRVDVASIEGSDATDQINAAVDSALDTAIPGSPTADSINERIKAIDDKLPTGTISDVTTAEVKAEVVDALNTDTYAEPASVPAATATLVAKLNWLAALARNKITQTATTSTLRNDADGADIATSTVSDDGTTATRGEWT